MHKKLRHIVGLSSLQIGKMQMLNYNPIKSKLLELNIENLSKIFVLIVNLVKCPIFDNIFERTETIELN